MLKCLNLDQSVKLTNRLCQLQSHATSVATETETQINLNPLSAVSDAFYELAHMTGQTTCTDHRLYRNGWRVYTSSHNTVMKPKIFWKLRSSGANGVFWSQNLHSIDRGMERW